MANYANLLATIAANIKAGNGVNATTGYDVETALDSMVASLGAGYQFMGVATPATNPGNLDTRQFYIASTPGTYTNFVDSGGDALEVNDGEVAVLKYDTAWSKEVTGAAPANVSDWEPLTPLIYDGYQVSSIGNFTLAGDPFIVAGYPVTEGDELYIVTRAGVVLAVAAFTDLEITNPAHSLISVTAGKPTTPTGYNIAISKVVPTGAKYCYVSGVNYLDVQVFRRAQLSRSPGELITLTGVEKGVYADADQNRVPLYPFAIFEYALPTSPDSLLAEIMVQARAGASAWGYFTDADGDYIAGSKFNGAFSTATNGYTFIKYLAIPSGAARLFVSCSMEFPPVVSPGAGIYGRVLGLEKTLLLEESGRSRLYGKKIGLLGDSIAAGSAASTPAQRFINVAATILGATIKNAAIGGWYLGNYENKSVYKQVNGESPAGTSLDGDEDLVVIFAGTNDFGHAFPIGEAYTEVTSAGITRKVPSTDAMETCGGLVKTIQTLYTKYGGYIPIVICTPLQRFASGGNSQTPADPHAPEGPWAKNTEGKYLQDYVDAIYAVADLYGIPVFDCFHNNMNPNVSAANVKYFADGLHPNDAGHALLGKQLALFLDSNIFDL